MKADERESLQQVLDVTANGYRAGWCSCLKVMEEHKAEPVEEIIRNLDAMIRAASQADLIGVITEILRAEREEN